MVGEGRREWEWDMGYGRKYLLSTPSIVIGKSSELSLAWYGTCACTIVCDVVIILYDTTRLMLLIYIRLPLRKCEINIFFYNIIYWYIFTVIQIQIHFINWFTWNWFRCWCRVRLMCIYMWYRWWQRWYSYNVKKWTGYIKYIRDFNIYVETSFYRLMDGMTN